jgi:hypothetical protein
MTQQEMQIIVQQVRRIAGILDERGIKFRFYTSEGFVRSTDNFIHFIRENYANIALHMGELELDIIGISCSMGSDWDRLYCNDWSILIEWLLDKKFQDEFHSELDQRVLYSLFQ